MMEGKGVTAKQSPSPGRDGIERRIDTRSAGADAASAADMGKSMAAPEDEREADAGESAPREPDDREPGTEVALPGAWQRSRVRVDARLLEATLLNLQKRIAAIPLVFDIQIGRAHV